MSFTSVEEPERRKIPGCSSPAREKTHVDQPNNPGDGIRLISGKRIYQRFCTQMFGKLPQNKISRNYKIANKRLLLSTEEPCRTCHYELKRRKALWLQAREALWANCKRRSQAHRDFSRVRKMNCCFARCAAKKVPTRRPPRTQCRNIRNSPNLIMNLTQLSTTSGISLPVTCGATA